MITRCPKCDTSFRITEAQLKTAKGAVRCGACLHIFKAMDHIVSKSDVPAKPASKTKPATQQPAAKPSAAPAQSTTAAKPASQPAVSSPTQAPKKSALDAPAQEKPASAHIPEKAKPSVARKNPVRDFPKFEYHKPTGKIQPTPSETTPTAAGTEFDIDDPKSFGLPDDIMDEASTSANSVVQSPVTADEGMENMLKFDQHTIDENDNEGDLFIDDDDLLISDDLQLSGEDDEEPARDGAYGDDLSESFIDLGQWKPQGNSLFDRKEKPPKASLGDEDDDLKSMADESWAVELLDDDDDGEPTPQFSRPTPISSPILDLDEEGGDDKEIDDQIFDSAEDDDPIADYSRVTTGSFNALEDDEIEEALGEPLSNRKIEPKVTEPSDFDDEDEESYSAGGYSDDFQQAIAQNAESRQRLRDEDEDGEYDEALDYYQSEYDQDRGAMLRGIQPEPVEFEHGYGHLDWKPKAIWGGLTAALCLALVIQVGWLQYDKLSRVEPYRGLYATLGVSVPPLQAPHLIKTTNFFVREHPKAADALMIDTILLNTAPHTQQFPNLVITFTNLHGNVVASRSFSPDEYLSGELAGTTEMPSNQPVHLALEILNPGPEAVNYAAYIQ
ncbi:hypothetical protein NBRC116495_19020 [Aurantivibrio plasticivorans]